MARFLSGGWCLGVRTVAAPGTTSAVIIGLDPVIQNALLRDPGRRRKLSETSALLDCRVKPGNDGKVGAGREAVRTA
ncbi:MAG: hypothetical protein IID49_01600 [Proteobacteria bacterium]|nr:hypothetical protein [Pseudomonadota bacterium]